MDSLIALGLSAVVLGFVAGVVIGLLRLSALRSFTAVYSAILLVAFVALLVQGPFVLALLGTLVVALVTMVPGGAGFVGGTWLAKTMKAGNEDPGAP